MVNYTVNRYGWKIFLKILGADNAKIAKKS